MILLQAMVLIFVAIGATAVVFTREPLAQSIVVSFYGILLGILFFLFQAPDVALSQIVVGAVALPLMIMLALAKARGEAE
jgi:energy-converting hydrogenase B subunit D